MERLAVYPGTFDPFTNGHLDIVLRSMELFDRLIIAVANSVPKGVLPPKKKTLFTVEERMELIRLSIPDGVNVTIDHFDGLAVDYVQSQGGLVIIRGLRAVSDFEYELQMALINRRLNPDVDTIFKMPSEEYSFITSTAVKEIVSMGGPVKDLVPRPVEDALLKKFKN